MIARGHDNSGPRRRKGSDAAARGFTLIEMLITLVVAAILLGLAIPSYNDAVLGSRVSNLANDLIASIQLARGEAIKRNAPVTLCRSANGTTCAVAGSWEQGWIVAQGATVFQYQQPAPTGFKVVAAGGAGTLTFQPIGIGATAATFKVCRESPVGKQERLVNVSATGMAYVTTTEAGVCP